MPSLLETQERFAAALRGTDRAAQASGLFRGPERRTRQRLGIYRGNLHANWSKALAGAYPIVRKIVGEDFFEGMSRAYAKTHPSTSGNLNNYGRRLADFIEHFPHTTDLPYLPDVARMEWFAHLAYYAADAAPGKLPPDTLQADKLDALRLDVAPGCAILSSRWPLARIWETHQDDYDGDIAVGFDTGPETITIYRRGWKAAVMAVPAADASLLAASIAGSTFGEALEAAHAVDPALDPAATLARLMATGVAVGLSSSGI